MGFIFKVQTWFKINIQSCLAPPHAIESVALEVGDFCFHFDQEVKCNTLRNILSKTYIECFTFCSLYFYVEKVTLRSKKF